MSKVFLRRVILRTLATSVAAVTVGSLPGQAYAADPANAVTLKTTFVTASYFGLGSYGALGGISGSGYWDTGSTVGNSGDYIEFPTVDIAQRSSDARTTCDAKEGKPDAAGNPIIFSTGNKIEPQNDFSAAGEMGLTLNRTYNFYWDGIGIFGNKWLSSFDYKLLIASTDPDSPCYAVPGTSPYCDATNQPIWAQRVDGRKIKFNYVGGSPKKWVEDKASPVASIVLNPNGSYTLNSEERTVETYDSSGFPFTIMNEHGVGWTFTWSANHLLSKVAHNSGRSVSFTWIGTKLTAVTDPAGNIFQYSYQEYFTSRTGVGRNVLSRVIMPGVSSPSTTGGTPAVTMDFAYGDYPGDVPLIGIKFNGSQYAQFGYDANGMANLTSHANNVEKYTFAYSMAQASRG